MKKAAWFAWAMCSVACFACSEETADQPTDTDSEETIPSGKGRVEGVVTDGDGVPLEAVTVKAADVTATTGYDGRFTLDLEPGTAVVAFAKPGYAETALSLSVTEGAAVPIQEGMVKRRAPQAVDIDDGGTAGEEARVTLTSGSLVTHDGTTAEGEVMVSITPVDVTGDLTAAPGDFSAVASSGADSILETLGMAEYYFEDSDGNKLQVADGEKVTVELDLPGNVVAEVGDKIPAWYFDTESGKWQEEGEGEVVEDENGLLVWRVQVSHFSWWNCDKPIEEKDCLTGTITDCNDNPVKGASIRARGTDYQGESSAYGEPDGTYCIEMKRGAAADLVVAGKVGGETVGRSVSVTGADVGASCEAGGCTTQDIQLPCDPGESDLDCIDSPLFPCSSCLSGRIVTPDGNPVDKAVITMTNEAYGIRASTMSSADGGFCVTAPKDTPVSLKINATDYPPLTVETTATETGRCPDCEDLGDIALKKKQEGGDTVYDTCNISEVEIAATDLDGASSDMSEFPHVGMMIFTAGVGEALSGWLWLTNADDPDDADGTSAVFATFEIPAGSAAGGSTALDGMGVTNSGGIVGVNADYYAIGSSSLTWNEAIVDGAQTLTGNIEFELLTDCGTALHTIQYEGTFSTQVLTMAEYVSMPECIEFLGLAFASFNIGSVGALSLDIDGTPDLGTDLYVSYSVPSDRLNIIVTTDTITFNLAQEAPAFGTQDVMSASYSDNSCIYQADESPELVIETNDAEDLSESFSGTFSVDLPAVGTDCGDPVTVSGTFTAAVCAD